MAPTVWLMEVCGDQLMPVGKCHGTMWDLMMNLK